MHKIDLAHIDLNLLITFEVLMREGNVTRAAETLGRTQSAVSHALARLREQLGDPLMIRAGGRMTPTPFALRLVDDVRPILRSLQHVLQPPAPFDPVTSTRIFRLSFPDISRSFMTNLFAAVQRQAPHVAIEWLQPNEAALPVIAGGQIDIAEWAGSTRLPDGIEVHQGAPYSWMTYMRRDHPAARDWGIDAWQTWPHLKVNIGNTVPSPVEEVAQAQGIPRKVQGWVPHLASLGPLLARTDFLATFPPIAMVDALEEFDLVALPPPVPIAPLPLRFLWSFRLTNDPGSCWFRNLVIDTFEAEHKRAEAGLARQ